MTAKFQRVHYNGPTVRHNTARRILFFLAFTVSAHTKTTTNSLTASQISKTVRPAARHGYRARRGGRDVEAAELYPSGDHRQRGSDHSKLPDSKPARSKESPTHATIADRKAGSVAYDRKVPEGYRYTHRTGCPNPCPREYCDGLAHPGPRRTRQTSQRYTNSPQARCQLLGQYHRHMRSRPKRPCREDHHALYKLPQNHDP